MKKKKKEPEFIEPERSYVAVFGYGSLVAPHELELRKDKYRPAPFYANLHGFSRNWLVTGYECGWMGREHYLGIDFAGNDSIVNGAIIYVDEAGLERLDRREALYHRQRVDGLVTFTDGIPLDGPIYTYIPTTFAVSAAQRRVKEGTAFISHRYNTIVTEAFKAAGQLDQFLSTTPVPDGMVVRPKPVERERWIEGDDGFVRPVRPEFHVTSAFDEGKQFRGLRPDGD